MISSYFQSDTIPKALVEATCEMAREVLIADRTDAPDGEGIAQVGLVGSVSLTFDKEDRQALISGFAQAMLSKLGRMIRADGGITRLIRT